MSSKGGLRTAASVAQENEQKRKRERSQREEGLHGQRGDADVADRQEETIYRDASGRKVDVKAEKARQKRERDREVAKEMERMEWGKGLVQRQEKEARERELQEAAAKPLARYADDPELNQAQREQQRWNDPAAAFLSQGPQSQAKSSKPVYKGPPPPPNRFGIRPGYRWDGVDRGNGFEKKLVQKENDRRRRTAEAYSYSVDDM